MPPTSRSASSTSRPSASWSSPTTSRAPAVPVAVEAAGFAGAHLVLLVSGDPSSGAAALTLPPDATVLAVPADDEGAFATLVGAYAAALDFGRRAGRGVRRCRGRGRRGGPAGVDLSYSSPSCGSPGCASPGSRCAMSSGPLLRTLFTSGGTG